LSNVFNVAFAVSRILFCSLAVLDQRVGHTTNVLSPSISILSSLFGKVERCFDIVACVDGATLQGCRIDLLQGTKNIKVRKETKNKKRCNSVEAEQVTVLGSSHVGGRKSAVELEGFVKQCI